MAHITATTAGGMACSYALSRLVSGEPEKKEAVPQVKKGEEEEPKVEGTPPNTTKSGTNAVEGSSVYRPIHRTDPDFHLLLEGKTPPRK